MMPNIRTKNIYEAIMHRQRMAEAKKQCDQVENKKFFQDSDVRARQEKRWTSESSFNNSMMAYLLPDKEAVLNNLEARKSKLRSLLQKEADFYEISDSEASDAVESKTVVYDSHKSNEHQRDIALQRKTDELRQFEREVFNEELEEIEKEILKQQRLLQGLETERRKTDEARLQRRFEKVTLRQHSTALIRRSRQVQTEITADLAYIDSLLALVGEEQENERGEGLRSRLITVKEMLKEELRHEERRENDMDGMLASEAAELAKKREQEWRCLEDARIRLLTDVLSMCRDRVDARLKALKQIKLERVGRLEALKRGVTTTELQRKPSPPKEHINGESCINLAETDGADRRSSHAEAVFEETLRKEAEKLNVSMDEIKKVAAEMGYDKAPFTGNRHKTQLW
ncbi:unnamed protein product [Hydatigera taeniaeformis]|uniref:Trichoplein keratin filament-binding protein n=1 Tax=Hydatigena taeniaeformis TaxID=6205 RepID=A0A0R3X4R9_HYDTA|nr:unnamed protein product [Hydatigera taeniaeformis]